MISSRFHIDTKKNNPRSINKHDMLFSCFFSNYLGKTFVMIFFFVFENCETLDVTINVYIFNTAYIHNAKSYLLLEEQVLQITVMPLHSFFQTQM